MSTSIVISVHNKAKYLERFLSVMRTTCPNTEFILVDDGSSDGSGDILKKFADVFIRTEDIWEVKANNVGLRAANGDYVAIVQDDDLILAYDWLRLCTEFMEKNNIDILGGRGYGHFYFIYYDNQAFLNKCRPGTKFYHNVGEYEFYLRYMSTNFAGMHYVGRLEVLIKSNITSKNAVLSPVFTVDGTYRSPFIISRRAIEQLGYFDERYAPLGFDDHDYCFRAERAGLRVAMTNVPKVERFESGSSWLYEDGAKAEFMRMALATSEQKFMERFAASITHSQPADMQFLGTIPFTVGWLE